ncbi:hypothetical protein [uncultured Martelella sp.]|uniref:hypothetical protein n=1 Tax=uncultured Martelella sp. TaxID=392331 RepID=UPI0029C863A9|nr:hypothetical protein [uncultured Martelella sp.]
MSSKEFKPCPFCGDKMMDRGGTLQHVEQGEGAKRCPIGVYAWPVEDADRWNTRAATDTVKNLAGHGRAAGLRALMAAINERYRQVAVEGWTVEHDDAHGPAVLAAASGCYALHAHDDGQPKGFTPAWWPFADEWYRPTTAERDLIKSIALGLAALEAEYRAKAKGGAA